MSKFFDIADQMATALVANPALSSVSVVVDRQKDLNAELRKIVGKIAGIIILAWDGGNLVDQEGPLVFDCRYVADIWAKPIIRPGQATVDDMLQAVVKTLNGWNPVEGAHCDYNAHVTSVEPFQNDSYLIHRINLQIRIKIP